MIKFGKEYYELMVFFPDLGSKCYRSPNGEITIAELFLFFITFSDKNGVEGRLKSDNSSGF